MSANGLPVFDRTLQTTHIWLDQITDRIGHDRQASWKVLSVVLHKLRDLLRVEDAAHLGAQLPLLIRGVYYDQYKPAIQPSRCRTREEFVGEVEDWLADARPSNAENAIAAVFDVLSRNIDPGEIEKIKRLIPEPIRELWQEAEEPV